MNIVLLIVALILSSIAAFYSVAGLMSIFSGAGLSIILMGAALEISKVSLTLWLHQHWHSTKLLLRSYLTGAIIILMGITSLGVFGFLSKSHISQSLNGSSIESKITILDTQISNLQREQETNAVTLSQLDNAITSVISHGTTENGAARALSLRNAQQSERKQIAANQQNISEKIANLKSQEEPLKLEFQKNEVEVGPIKYIAALIYGGTPNQDLLEKSVRWVIILLVIVFDPLALAMLLAADQQFIDRAKKPKIEEPIVLDNNTPETKIKKIRKPRKKKNETIYSETDTPFPVEINNDGQHLIGKLILPESAPEGSLFITTDRIPGTLYKYLSGQWIEVDKNSNNGYLNDGYIKFLIKHLEDGTATIDQLTPEESSAVEKHLQNS